MSKELKDIALQAIDETVVDADLCATYPRICAYATDPLWKDKTATRIALEMLKSELSDVFEAMEIIELQLGTND